MSHLAQTAMLASVNISCWTATKHDKAISDKVADEAGASRDMGRYNKRLLSKSALEKLSQISQQARKDFYTHTLPWYNDGSRILTSAGYFKLAEIMRKHEQEWEPALKQFLAEYPNMKAEAKIQLNGNYREEDYPSEAAIGSKFSFGFRVCPLPVADDFRVQLNEAAVSQIRQQITDSLNEQVETAKREVWTRMKKVVSHMANVLREYKTRPRTKLYDSVVTNISDLLEVIPALNLDNDPQVTKFAADMKALTKYTPDALKESDGTREQIAKAADDILAKMSSII